MSLKRSFTLIELVVVISLALLLLTLLTNSLKSMTAMAHQAQCASNLKQVGIGNAIYMNDHADWMLVYKYMNHPIPASGSAYSSATDNPSVWWEYWPDEIRWCPTMLSSSTTEFAYPPYASRNPLLESGYAYPLLESSMVRRFGSHHTANTYRDLYATNLELEPLQFPDYMKLQHGSKAQDWRGEAVTYYGKDWVYVDSLPVASDMIIYSATRSISAHNRGHAKTDAYFKEPDGANSLWSDGRVTWHPWERDFLAIRPSYRDIVTNKVSTPSRGGGFAMDRAVFWTKPLK